MDLVLGAGGTQKDENYQKIRVEVGPKPPKILLKLVKHARAFRSEIVDIPVPATQVIHLSLSTYYSKNNLAAKMCHVLCWGHNMKVNK